METRIQYGDAAYCDIGPRAGMTRVSIRADIYMTDEEYQAYQQTGSLRITVEPVPGPEGDQPS
jgi:hypothetical protein